MDIKYRLRQLLTKTKTFVTSRNYSVILVLVLAGGFIAAGYNLMFLYLSTTYCEQWTQAIEITLCNHGSYWSDQRLHNLYQNKLKK